MKTILAFGETLWDLLPDGAVLGGAACNFAYRAGSLGDRARLVTRLGRDELGRRAFEALSSLGLETAFVQWDEHKPTGTVPVKIDGRGVPEFRIVPDVAYEFIEPADELLALAAEADAVYFGTLGQRGEVSRRTLSRVLEAAPRALRFLDINLRKDCDSADVVEGSLSRAQVLKLNEGEARELRRRFGLGGDTPAALAREIRERWSLRACVVTLGEEGALAVSPEEEVAVAGRRVRVVDTVGSGDAFSAAFLSRYLAGRPLRECCRFGNDLGALVAAKKGATAPISREEIERFAGASQGG